MDCKFSLCCSADSHSLWFVLHVRSLSQYYERWLYDDDEICFGAQCGEDKESTFWHSLFEHWSTRLQCIALSPHLSTSLSVFRIHVTRCRKYPGKSSQLSMNEWKVDGWEAKKECLLPILKLCHYAFIHRHRNCYYR